MKQDNTNQQEEVDLGKLFQIIGNGFKKLFSTIGNLFKSIFHYGILLLIFFKKNAIILGAAIILGGILGYILEIDKKTEYASNMIVETNFGSGHRLYNQLDYLNTLISEEDTITLSEIFNIESTKASKLNSFVVEPYDREKNLKVEYDYYMQHTDTIYTREFKITDFEERLSDQDFRLQNIIIYSSESKIFKNLKGGIVNLVENEYFKKLYDIKNSELTRRKVIVEKDLKVIDSLRKIYKEVAILDAKNTNASSTNIDLSGKRTSKNKDIELFKENNNLVYRLKSIDKEMIRSNFIMNVISDFDNGKVYSSIKERKWLKYALVAFLLTLLVIIGLKVNTYISKYEKSL